MEGVRLAGDPSVEDELNVEHVAQEAEEEQIAPMVETLANGKSKRGPKPNSKYRDFVAYNLPVTEEGIPTTLKEVDMSYKKDK